MTRKYSINHATVEHEKKQLNYLIRILCNVIETDESSNELAVEKVVRIIDRPQTPVSVVV